MITIFFTKTFHFAHYKTTSLSFVRFLLCNRVRVSPISTVSFWQNLLPSHNYFAPLHPIQPIIPHSEWPFPAELIPLHNKIRFRMDRTSFSAAHFSQKFAIFTINWAKHDRTERFQTPALHKIQLKALPSGKKQAPKTFKFKEPAASRHVRSRARKSMSRAQRALVINGHRPFVCYSVEVIAGEVWSHRGDWFLGSVVNITLHIIPLGVILILNGFVLKSTRMRKKIVELDNRKTIKNDYKMLSSLFKFKFYHYRTKLIVWALEGSLRIVNVLFNFHFRLYIRENKSYRGANLKLSI